jgi:hypothetical protein
MRAALALATALTTTSLVGLGTAAPARATACEAQSPGVTISHIELGGGLNCDHAKQVIHHALGGRLREIGWTCHEYGAHHIPFTCRSHNGSGHWLTFFVVVGDGSGPGGF